MHCNVVRFSLGDCKFVVADRNIEAVVSIDQLYEMQSGPSWVPGIISYEGRPMLAIDTGLLLGIQTSEYTSMLVAVRDDDRIALLVSKFDGHHDFPDTLVDSVTAQGVLGDLVRAQINIEGSVHYCFNIQAFFENSHITAPHK